MAVSLQTVTLDTDDPDRDGLMVFRDGKLLAILSCLSDIHEELEGRWFVEAIFGKNACLQPPTFATPDEFEQWVSREG